MSGSEPSDGALRGPPSQRPAPFINRSLITASVAAGGQDACGAAHPRSVNVPDVSLLSHGIAYALGGVLTWHALRAVAPPARSSRSMQRPFTPPAAPPSTQAAFLLLMTLGLWWPHHWLAGSPRPTLGSAIHVGLAAATAALVFTVLRVSWRWPLRPWGRALVAVLLTGLGATAANFVGIAVVSEATQLDAVQAALIACVIALARRPATATRAERRAPDFSKTMQLKLASIDQDALTQLATRERFEKRLTEAMAVTDRTLRPLAVLFIDLDGFKPVNDTYGHSVGDEVLRQVGRRMQALSRGGDLVARIGGDEFLMMIERVSSPENAVEVAKRLIRTVSKPYLIDGREINISCSIGIAKHPGAGSMAKLVAQADAAMYAAKRAGKSSFRVFTASMESNAEQGMELARDLRHAMERQQFELVYQPKIDARNGQVTGAEALLRWRHPAHGDVPPTVFIPISERFGLMTALSDWVIEEACRQCRAWRDKGLRMRVAINLSAQQMRRDDLVQHLYEMLKKHRIHPSLLTCEITESLAMEDTKATQDTFRRLGQLGIHVSIDDFGTGYSSLAYLRRLPAQELKIDRSFIVDLENSADARAVVDAVVKLAHALGLKVVAEGVESPRQQEILAQLGCDELQGFLFAKPMSARALLIWALSDRSEDTAAFKASLFGDTSVLAGGASPFPSQLPSRLPSQLPSQTPPSPAPATDASPAMGLAWPGQPQPARPATPSLAPTSTVTRSG